MWSRSGYGRTVGAVHSLGHSVVWPKFHRPVLGGGVADRLRELIVGKVAAWGGSFEAPTTRPTRGWP